MTVTVEWQKDGQRMERCDHDGTTEPLNGLASISSCTACGKTWPARFGAGAATVRIVPAAATVSSRPGRTSLDRGM
jgi:hypothetical protein